MVLWFIPVGCSMPQLVRAEIPTIIPTPTWTVVPLVLNTSTTQPTQPTQPTQEPTPTPEPTETPTPSGSSQCPASPPQRVDLDMRARVTFTDGTSLRLRKDPIVNATNVLMQIPEGTPFNIIGGPSCWEDGSNFFTFWQIQLDNNQTGWVAEGNAIGYFIEPLP